MQKKNTEISMKDLLDQFYPIFRPNVETLNSKVYLDYLEEINDEILPQQNCLLEQLAEPQNHLFGNNLLENPLDETNTEISEEFIMVDQKQNFQFKPIGQLQFQQPEVKPFQTQDVIQEELESEVTQTSQTNQVQIKIQEKVDQISLENSKSAPEKPKKKITKDHLRGTRRSKNKKTQLQKQFKSGYWMKNFLQFGKKPHFEWILSKTLSLSQESQDLQLARKIKVIRQKIGIGLQDYLILYKIPQLKEIWEEFFRKKILYRELMLSRAEPLSKVAFVKFLHRYEEAFRTGIFNHIA